MKCELNPKMVVLFVLAIILLYFIISGSLLTACMFESFTNSGNESLKGEISSCVDIERSLAQGNQVVVALHANWCGHCKAMSGEWNKFHENITHIKGVDAFAIDHGAGKDHVVTDFKNKFGFESRGFPTIIKLEKAGDSHKVTEFEGARDAASFKKFCGV